MTVPLRDESGSGDTPDPARRDSARIDRAALDRIFGSVLPDTTSDERDPGESRAGSADDWYQANRPPHHG